MVGFHSDMMWLPRENVGAVILTNANPGWVLRTQYRRKLLEVLFDGKSEADAQVAAQAKTFYAELAAERKLLTVPAESAESAKLAPRYANAALGEIAVTHPGAETVFDFGEEDPGGLAQEPRRHRLAHHHRAGERGSSSSRERAEEDSSSATPNTSTFEAIDAPADPQRFSSVADLSARPAPRAPRVREDADVRGSEAGHRRRGVLHPRVERLARLIVPSPAGLGPLPRLSPHPKKRKKGKSAGSGVAWRRVRNGLPAATSIQDGTSSVPRWTAPATASTPP